MPVSICCIGSNKCCLGGGQMEERILLRNGWLEAALPLVYFSPGQSSLSPRPLALQQTSSLNYHLCIVIPDWLIEPQRNIKSSFTIPTLSCRCVASKEGVEAQSKIKEKKKSWVYSVISPKSPFLTTILEKQKKRGSGTQIGPKLQIN